MAEISLVRKVITHEIVPKVHELPKGKEIAPSSPIGTFDSGVGGLTVLKEIERQLPYEDVIYIADTARVPYGGRSVKEIIKINYEIINYLVSEGVKMVIMACGTSSSIAYPIVKGRYKLPIIGLIEPGAKVAAAATKNKKIGLIATALTVESGAYQNAILKIDKNITIYAQACPLFVPLVEGGFIEASETKKVAKEYLRPLLKAKIDTLILGCTHYPHLSKILREICGPDVVFIDPAEETVKEAKMILTKFKQLNSKRVVINYQFLVTGSPTAFQDVGSRLLGKPIANVRQISLVAKGR